MQWKWLLFDLDNTVMDFTSASKLALQQTFERLNIPYQKENIDAYKTINHQVWNEYEAGQLDVDGLSHLRAQLFLQSIARDDIQYAHFDDIYLDLLASHSVYLTGVEETLSVLKNQGFRMVIATNGLTKVQRKRWAETNLSDHFEDIFIAQEIGKPKPHSFFFDWVHGKIGRPNRQSVMMIGDNPISDIKGSNDYGYTTCWYDRGVIEKKPKAHFTITQMSEILPILT